MLIQCPECDNGCSEEATSCPKCGHPLKPVETTQPTRVVAQPISPREELAMAGRSIPKEPEQAVHVHQQRTQVIIRERSNSGCLPALILLLLAPFLFCAYSGNCLSESYDTARSAKEEADRIQEQATKSNGYQPKKYRYQSCRDWGASDDYLNMLAEGYFAVKQAGMSRNEVIKGTRDACIERVNNDSQLRLCEDCVTKIVKDVFRNIDSAAPEIEEAVQSKKYEARRYRYRACKKWGVSYDHLNALAEGYFEAKQAGEGRISAIRDARNGCKYQVDNKSQMQACQDCVTSIVKHVYKER